MDRNFRFRVSGIAFFIILLLHIGLSTSGTKFVESIIDNKNSLDNIEILATLISIGFIFFASDFTGYLFSSIFFYYFNKKHKGYDGLYEVVLGDLKTKIMKDYNKMKNNNVSAKIPFDLQLDNYTNEQLFVIFFWHRRDGASNNLNDWIARRHTAYFTAYSFLTASIFASIFSAIIICVLNIKVSWINLIILILTFIVSLIIRDNGKTAMDEAIAITGLHVVSYSNPMVRDIYSSYSLPNNWDQNSAENT